jgi:hypothetical protein
MAPATPKRLGPVSAPLDGPPGGEPPHAAPGVAFGHREGQPPDDGVSLGQDRHAVNATPDQGTERGRSIFELIRTTLP